MYTDTSATWVLTGKKKELQRVTIAIAKLTDT